MTFTTPLSKKDRSFLNLAMKVAETSECTQKHGAVLVKSGSVISIGVNKWRNHPSVLSKSNIPRDCTIHAEEDALSRTTLTKGATLYVARINKNGRPLLSHPCKHCQKLLQDKEVKKVVYTES